MSSKDQSPRIGRARPESRSRQEQLWAEPESDNLFDPDQALADAEARLEEPALEESGAPTEGPAPAADEPEAADVVHDTLPVPPLDDSDDSDEGDDGDHSVELGSVLTVDAADPRFETVDDPRIPEGRDSFKIGETAGIVGVRPYVLRYWESELSFVRPAKTEAGQRRFSRTDVATLLQVKRLRHDAGLTMAQTRTLITEGRGSEVAPPASERGSSPWIIKDADAQSRVRQHLQRMREAVLDLLQTIDAEEEEHNG